MHCTHFLLVWQGEAVVGTALMAVVVKRLGMCIRPAPAWPGMNEALGVALLFGCFTGVRDGVPALCFTGLAWLLCVRLYVSICRGCRQGCRQSREGIWYVALLWVILLYEQWLVDGGER